MDEMYVSNMEKNEIEYLCGEYSYGRYAWILEDIEPLENIIPARGSLSIWEYKNND